MRYYIVQTWDKTLVRTCDCFQEVKRWFAGDYSELAMSENDTSRGYAGDWPYFEPVYYQRRYMVFDENGRTIDPRMHIDDEPCKSRPRDSMVWVGGRCRYVRVSEVKFRSGPVPGIRCTKRHRGRYYRRIRTTNEKRQSADKEIRKYIRGRRANLPDAWDDFARSFSQSWKEKKIKRQWMKHLPR